jgi:GxxExxY protein
MDIDEITGIIIDKAIKIHKELGPGLLESVYETVLFSLLKKEGLKRIVNRHSASDSPRLRVNKK